LVSSIKLFDNFTILIVRSSKSNIVISYIIFVIKNTSITANMRFSSTAILALPLLAAAAQQQNPLEQVLEQARPYFDKVKSYIPHLNTYHHAEAAAAKAGGKNLNILSIDNWAQTLLSSATPSSKQPVEWWVLLTGGNKTCFGQCDKINSAYNETALLFAADPTAPHLAYVNCDYQPILCNSWAAGPPSLWVFEVSAPPALIPVHIVGLNTTTTTVKTLTDLKNSKSWKEKPAYEGYFHPFDGPLAKFGLALPLAYALWVFAVIPSWAFMIGVSFLSRSMMGRRVAPPGGARA